MLESNLDNELLKEAYEATPVNDGICKDLSLQELYKLSQTSTFFRSATEYNFKKRIDLDLDESLKAWAAESLQKINLELAASKQRNEFEANYSFISNLYIGYELDNTKDVDSYLIKLESVKRALESVQKYGINCELTNHESSCFRLKILLEPSEKICQGLGRIKEMTPETRRKIDDTRIKKLENILGA